MEEKEFKPITTQEDFDAAIKSRLERQERKTAEEVEKRFEGWISPKDAEERDSKITTLSQELSAKKGEIEQLTAENKKYANDAVRAKIAHEKGIPFELASKLSGETEEEIRADADTLAKYISKAQSSPKFNSEQRADDKKAALRNVLDSLNSKI